MNGRTKQNLKRNEKINEKTWLNFKFYWCFLLIQDHVDHDAHEEGVEVS